MPARLLRSVVVVAPALAHLAPSVVVVVGLELLGLAAIAVGGGSERAFGGAEFQRRDGEKGPQVDVGELGLDGRGLGLLIPGGLKGGPERMVGGKPALIGRLELGVEVAAGGKQLAQIGGSVAVLHIVDQADEIVAV